MPWWLELVVVVGLVWQIINLRFRCLKLGLLAAEQAKLVAALTTGIISSMPPERVRLVVSGCLARLGRQPPGMDEALVPSEPWDREAGDNAPHAADDDLPKDQEALRQYVRELCDGAPYNINEAAADHLVNQLLTSKLARKISG